MSENYDLFLQAQKHLEKVTKEDDLVGNVVGFMDILGVSTGT